MKERQRKVVEEKLKETACEKRITIGERRER